MADFDIIKVAAARNKGGRPRKIAETTEVTLEVPGDGGSVIEPKFISIDAPAKPIPAGMFIAPQGMDPLEDAVFAKTTFEVAQGTEKAKSSKRLSEKTLLEMERGKKVLRLR